jgi:hypothetical protein
MILRPLPLSLPFLLSDILEATTQRKILGVSRIFDIGNAVLPDTLPFVHSRTDKSLREKSKYIYRAKSLTGVSA